MKPDTLTFEVTELKTLGADEPAGTFEAIVAVFGNVDRGGDIVEPGAFRKTLSPRAGRGLPPIVWSHNWDTPPIGVTTEAEETEKGLRIKGRLFVGEGEDSPVARQVYTAMKAKDGRGKSPLREFSFGYAATEVGFKDVDGQEVRLIKSLDLFEVGPTLVGMNPATELVAVKTTSPPEGGQEEQKDNPPNGDQQSPEEAERIGQLLGAMPTIVTTTQENI